MAMKKAEIKAIAEYLKDLEEGLYEWEYRGLSLWEQKRGKKDTELNT